MKFLAINKYNLFSANYFDYTVGNSGGGDSTKTYFPAGRVSFSGGVGQGNGLLIYSKTPMRLFAQINGVSDRKGNIILKSNTSPDGALYEVRTCVPMLNAFGTTEGYQISLTSLETGV